MYIELYNYNYKYKYKYNTYRNIMQRTKTPLRKKSMLSLVNNLLIQYYQVSSNLNELIHNYDFQFQQ